MDSKIWSLVPALVLGIAGAFLLLNIKGLKLTLELLIIGLGVEMLTRKPGAGGKLNDKAYNSLRTPNRSWPLAGFNSRVLPNQADPASKSGDFVRFSLVKRSGLHYN